MGKISVSLCMIVRDEEEVIGRCLDSVQGLFDEIIIVDTGSVDHTKEIVSKYTDHVYDFKWIYDFSAARNYSFSKATSDYIMWLDADDVIYPEDALKLKELFQNIDPDIEFYRMVYSYIQDQYDQATISQSRARLIRNNHKDRWVGRIHEVIPVTSYAPSLDIVIHHKKTHIADPIRNLNIYRRMEKEGDFFTTRDLFMFAVELTGNHEYDYALKILKKMFRRKNDYYKEKFYFDQAIMTKFRIYRETQRSNKEIKKMLLSTLPNFSPSAAVCCELGFLFNLEKNYFAGKFWFLSAIEVAKDYKDDHVDYNEFNTYFGVAYSLFYLGEIDRAIHYSSLALKIHPNNEAAIANHKLYLKAKNHK